VRLRRTPGGYSPADLISLLQKAIRRARPDLAAFAFNELEAGGYRRWAWSRLLVTVAEDLAPGLAAEIEALHGLDAEVNRARRDRPARVFWSRAILLMCAAAKNRDADHLTNLKLPEVDHHQVEALLADIVPAEIPEWTYDVHTQRGRARGKTRADFFRDEFDALEPRQPGLFDDLVPR
jgi:replication-associated recombination protein RarA